jgi:maltooligosyltrehalose trehalohydrolase
MPAVATTRPATRMLGATVTSAGVEFRVWVPQAEGVEVQFGEHRHAMQRTADDTFELTLPARAGQRYFYVVNGQKPVPDPVSRLLPEGVHGPTEIVDPEAFRWSDETWHGLPLEQYSIYELHVGTFSPSGTFDGAAERLDYLRQLGVTAIELMPVAAFPGERNWGYDGVSPYAVHAGYGGPDGLKRLVDAAHRCGLAVILDVVYNHLGNEGNYLRMFGPYFTAKHRTAWGDAINYDQPGSESVRRYFIENALYWVCEYHLDGLRLDAVQTIVDRSPRHIVAEIQQEVQALARELGRTVCVIAETDENDPRYTLAPPAGYGLNAVWSDDFHHAVHAYLTGESRGYYQDFGAPAQIAKALNQGFVFQGEHFRFWRRARGASSAGMAPQQHVIAMQNHDQVGNRARGDRFTALVSRGARMAAAALLLLSPHTPLIFMGEEYDEPAPFQFFTDYSDPALQKAVSEGRRREFRDFDWNDVPDPQDPATFTRSKLNWDLALRGDNRVLRWYRELLALRSSLYADASSDVNQNAAANDEARSCRAQWHEAEGVLTMDIPGAASAADHPLVRVIAVLRPEPDDARRQALLAHFTLAEAGLKAALQNEEDGYAVCVLRRT